MSGRNWAGLTPEEEGRRQRLDRWLNPEDAGFLSADAENAYRERVRGS